ncbi:hypothetical protein OEZ86_007489 [Tetradesmus obliquus]|nr:hypothetical protein OEZ86_007489 [Tetradesmus obliquus]
MDDEQPWKKHKQLGYGVTLDCSHPGRAKQFKVRLRLRSHMLNVGRFEDAHTARLAYDQIITGLGLCKPTNYRPGSYPLDNPEVEAKLQQFLDANPEMAAAAAAVVNGRIGGEQQAYVARSALFSGFLGVLRLRIADVGMLRVRPRPRLLHAVV